MNDEQLVREARDGNAEALDILLHRFKGLVKARAADFFIIGGDREDIVQEGMIGLYKAICDYDPEKSLNFTAFARLCVSRQIMSAIKASARQKHQPLNQSVSLSGPAGEDDGERDRYLDHLAAGRANDPETLLIGREELNDVDLYLQQHLSEMEYRVLTLHLQGRRRADIARETGRDMKSIDNTLQRIRRKAGKIVRIGQDS